MKEKNGAVLSDNPWVEAFRRLRKNKIAVAGFAVFLIICLACIFAPLLTNWTYYSIDVDNTMARPSSVHLFGTDSLGRDVFTRILYGGRMTLRVAFTSTILAALAGSIIGLAAGYFGGIVDFILSPFLDIIASIPVILLVLVTEAILGWGRGYYMYAMAIAATPQFARLIRASAMNVMGCEYIEAAKALGASHFGIMSRHVLHNIASPLIVRFTSGLAEAVLTCTIMGYLGVYINPPTPELGVIVFIARKYIRQNPHLTIIPCIVIAICVISISLFGDGLRDALDPRE